MSRLSAAALKSSIRNLQKEHQDHLTAIDEIDAVFGELGISKSVATRKRGRPAKKKAGKRGRPKVGKKSPGRPKGSGKKRGRPKGSGKKRGPGRPKGSANKVGRPKKKTAAS